ncbi:hypothetical protein ABPG75_007292 [Micractinium tetrahymenae]
MGVGFQHFCTGMLRGGGQDLKSKCGGASWRDDRQESHPTGVTSLWPIRFNTSKHAFASRPTQTMSRAGATASAKTVSTAEAHCLQAVLDRCLASRDGESRPASVEELARLASWLLEDRNNMPPSTGSATTALCTTEPAPAATAQPPPLRQRATSPGHHIVLPRSPAACSPFQARRYKACSAAAAAVAGAPAAATSRAALSSPPAAAMPRAVPSSPPAAVCRPGPASSEDSDCDVCSWLAGWAALAARDDVMPSAALQQLDRIANGGGRGRASTSSAAPVPHSSLPAPGSAMQPHAPRGSSQACAGFIGRKRKAPAEPAAAAELAAWAAKLARVVGEAAATAAARAGIMAPTRAPSLQATPLQRRRTELQLQPELAATLALLSR